MLQNCSTHEEIIRKRKTHPSFFGTLGSVSLREALCDNPRSLRVAKLSIQDLGGLLGGNANQKKEKRKRRKVNNRKED